MNRDEIRAALLRALSGVAPESDPAAIDAGADLREALDIDSMDFLRFVVAVHEALHVDVPEKDYPRLYTLAGATDYLAERAASR